MKVVLKYTIYVLGIASILLFCVSATAGIDYANDFKGLSFSEPFNMVLFGIFLIGIGNFAKNRLS
jgi:hypothetical protein